MAEIGGAKEMSRENEYFMANNGKIIDRIGNKLTLEHAKEVSFSLKSAIEKLDKSNSELKFYSEDETWYADSDESTVRIFRKGYQIIKAPKKDTPYAEYYPNESELQYILDALNEYEKTNPMIVK